jgi:hypothetical protein
VIGKPENGIADHRSRAIGRRRVFLGDVPPNFFKIVESDATPNDLHTPLRFLGRRLREEPECSTDDHA